MSRLIKIILVLILALTLVLIVVPLLVLAGLFVWLKLTEEGDEESLDLDQDNL
jgi:hypothetical protein